MRFSAFVAAAVIASLVLLMPVEANTCGGNCPSGNCPGNHCPCGLTPKPVSVVDFCSQYSGWSQTCCQCIATHESGGNMHAVNYDAYYQNFKAGVLQIPNMFWGKCSNGFPPCDSSASLNCAIENWKLGNGTWAMWDDTCPNCGSCCTSA